ncbi:MAG: hypothetical protein ACI9NC_002939, partial [Verrucomicrobiales bacterium]
VVMRRVETRLSIDIAHIRSGEEISQRVGASPRSLLLLGNSLTRDGIAAEPLASSAGEGLTVESYYPDGSSVNEWVFAYRRYFSEPGNQPDFLIIGAGRSHLFDSQIPPDRFGAYFCSRGDIPRYFKHNVKNLDHAAGFFLARYSAAYTNRKRIQPRIFTALIPHYQEVAAQLQTRGRTAGEKPENELEHRNLAELLKVAKAAGTHVAVVAIPMPKSYPLPQPTVQTIADGGAVLIDARNLPGIDASDFPDNYHLGSVGAKMLTEHVIKKLQPLWWPGSGGN